MGLFGKAKDMLQGWSGPEPEGPQAFRVRCPEGHLLRGYRAEGFQALRCPDCGEGVFVLPRSPLPEPPVPAAPARIRTASPVRDSAWDDAPIPLSDPLPPPLDDEPEEEVEWVDDSVEAEVAGGSSPPSRPTIDPADLAMSDMARARPASPTKPKARTASSQRTRAAGADDPPPRTIRLPEPDRETWGDWARRNRHRLAFFGVAALVMLSIGLALRRRWLEDAPRLIAIAQTQGIDSLDAGRFDEANRLLSKGAKAAGALGGAHRGAEEVRQAAAEAAIVVNLLRKPLEELIEEAARYDPPSGWAERFKDYYRGQSVVIDGVVLSPGTGESGPDLGYRIFTGRGPAPGRRGRIDTTGLTLLTLVPPEVGDRLVFGARLEAVTPGTDGTWRVRLEPESGVRMTHWKALVALGWPDPGAVADESSGVGGGREAGEDALRGATDQEVASRLGGRAERVARVATQGQVLEQWFYRGLKGTQSVNFLRRPGESRMIAQAHFTAAE